MEFITWPNAEEAQQAEAWLANEIIHAFTLSPSLRVDQIHAVFNEMRVSMDIEGKGNKVITNINPIRYLNKKGCNKAALDLLSMNVPFSSEGILIRKEDSLENKTNKIRRYIMPGIYQSILHHGTDSPLFSIPTAREMSNALKGYTDDIPFINPFQIEGKARHLIDVLSSDKMDYTHMWAWIDRAFQTEYVAHTAAEKSGLMEIFRPSHNEILDAVEKITSRNRSDTKSREHLNRLIDILQHKDTRHRSFDYLFVASSNEDGLTNPGKTTFEKSVEKINVVCSLILNIEPKKAKFLMGNLVSTALDMNYGLEGNEIIRAALKNGLNQNALFTQCNKKQASIIAAELSMPSLLSKASDQARSSVLMSNFDI